MSTEHGAGRTRIALRPIASPVSLGFLALGGATLTLAAEQLGWVGPQYAHTVGLVLVTFAFPLQLLASVVGFLARDGGVATGMGVLAATWLATGVVTVLSAPGSTDPALGILLLFAGAAVVIPAVACGLGKLVPAAVLLTAAARFAVTGVYELTADSGVEAAAGIVGLVLAAMAWYAALALELEDVRHRTVLPTGRVGRGREAIEGSATDQVHEVAHEAGVREQL